MIKCNIPPLKDTEHIWSSDHQKSVFFSLNISGKIEGHKKISNKHCLLTGRPEKDSNLGQKYLQEHSFEKNSYMIWKQCDCSAVFLF